jgi:hypothetical protein
MKIEGVAEILLNHGGALKVPARAPFTPRGRPEIITVLGLAAFPEHEVGEAVLFILIRTGAGILGLPEIKFPLIEVREMAVAGERRNFKID